MELIVIGRREVRRLLTMELCRYFVDYRYSALHQAGELLAAIEAGAVTIDHIVGEIGGVDIGKVSGRQTEDEITLYKSLGIPAEDLVVARYLYEHTVGNNPACAVPF